MKNLKTILTLVTRSMSAFFFETNRLVQKIKQYFYRILQKASSLSGRLYNMNFEGVKWTLKALQCTTITVIDHLWIHRMKRQVNASVLSTHHFFSI